MISEQKLIHSIGADIAVENIQIGKYRIHFAVAGSGPSLLLIHGINIGWGQWYPNIAELSKHFRVYALDLPGSGGSTKINFNKCNLEEDFVDVVDKFIEAKQLSGVSIAGHSFGGWITTKLALRDKPYIDKIVLVDSMGFTDYVPTMYKAVSFYPIAQLLSKTVMAPSTSNIRKFCKSVVHKSADNINDEFVEYFCESIKRERVTHPLLFINRLTNFRKIKKELMLIDELPNIQRPTLIIMGDKDPLIPLSRVQSACKLFTHAKMEIFSGVGHIPSLERAKRFNEVIINFLTS